MSYCRMPSPAFVLLISSFLFNLAVPGASVALPSGISMAEIGGRWSAEDRDFVLDIAVCGERLCGTKVEEGGRCGRTVLTLEADTQPGWNGTHFKGELAMPNAGDVFHAVAWVERAAANGIPKLHLRGWGGQSGEYVLRRHFPFDVKLVRSGEPVCQPAPIS
jgi:hypothetical protein